MASNNSKLQPMKTFTIGCRISEDLREKVEYAKLLPRGITGIVEDALRKMKVDPELMKKLKALK